MPIVMLFIMKCRLVRGGERRGSTGEAEGRKGREGWKENFKPLGNILFLFANWGKTKDNSSVFPQDAPPAVRSGASDVFHQLVANWDENWEDHSILFFSSVGGHLFGGYSNAMATSSYCLNCRQTDTFHLGLY